MHDASPAPSPADARRPDQALLGLGWDDAWSAAFARHLATLDDAHLDPGPAVGRVCRADLRASEVLVPGADGLEVVTTEWAPSLRAAAAHDPTALPAAGDWVVVSARTRARTEHQLDVVLPRRTTVVRAQVGGTSYGQVLAANADVAAVVEGMVPDLDPARLERLLALAWSSGAQPVVVLTKADLAARPDDLEREVRTLAPGAEVLAVATTRDEGLGPLRARLTDGATIALLGASGVGKSTLLNALVAPGGGGPMATRTLGAENKGRHTTVTRELHPGPAGGAVLDTPGLRTIGLDAGTRLDAVFPEVDELARRCRFGDCEHRTEPGCAVLAAVEAGELPARRLDSWRKLGREQAYQAMRTDRRLAAEHRARWRTVAQQQRRSPKRR